MTMLCENPGDIQGWQTDHDGKLRVAYAIVDGVNTQIRYRETEAEPFRPVLTTNSRKAFRSPLSPRTTSWSTPSPTSGATNRHSC